MASRPITLNSMTAAEITEVTLYAEENMAELDAAIALSESEQYQRGVDAGIAGVADIWEQALTGATPKQGVLGDERLERLCRMTEALRFKEPAADGWLPIKSVPKNTHVWVGRWVEPCGRDPEWRMCRSRLWFDSGINTPDSYEPSYWSWEDDNDSFGVTEDEGPTHWMPLPPPPKDQ